LFGEALLFLWCILVEVRIMLDGVGCADVGVVLVLCRVYDREAHANGADGESSYGDLDVFLVDVHHDLVLLGLIDCVQR